MTSPIDHIRAALEEAERWREKFINDPRVLYPDAEVIEALDSIIRALPVSAGEPVADDVVRDARRYRRLQVLGCAPYDTEQLRTGTVLRFSGLDQYVDADLNWTPSRGEAMPLAAPQPVAWLIEAGEKYERQVYFTEKEARLFARELDENGWLDVVVKPLYAAPQPVACPLPYVVQYRTIRDKAHWIDMAAFDREGPAKMYARNCAEGAIVWEYRVDDRSFETHASPKSGDGK